MIPGLGFRPIPVDGIRMASGEFITMEDCNFQGLGANGGAERHRHLDRLSQWDRMRPRRGRG